MTPSKLILPRLLIAALPVVAHTAAHAITLTGTVRNESGTGLVNVDLDFIDLCTGDNIFLSGDKTAVDGTYSIILPAGSYDIHYTPPAGSAVCAGDRQNYAANANADLGITTLHPGRLVSGVVQTPSLTPAAGVDLKFVDQATRQRVFLTKDVTNAAGQYSVRVPPGTYDIDFRPPASTAFTDKERIGLTVSGADVSGLADALGTGFIVTGTVQDKNNNKLKNVDIDVFDACTGKRIATAHDNTDVNGNYSVCVPAGTYTFNYDPPSCKAVEAARSPNTVISRNENLGTEQLKLASLVSGAVLKHDGQPMADAKLKFFDATAAGTPRQAAANDHTDAAGRFAIYLPPGTYDIDVEPPAGVLEQVGHWSGIVAAGPVNVGTLGLAAGVAVSGHVTGPGGAPVLNVNVNAVESATRTPQRLAHDDTDAAGNFTVVMAPGTYDIQYDPPACTGLAPTSQNGRTVAGATSLPALTLVTGVHATGSVFDTHASPAGNVDLDFYAAGSATKIYTPNDQTSASGAYDVLLPPGTYDIKYIPPSTTRLRPASLPGTALLTSQTLPALQLADGWFVGGLVKNDPALTPISGVTIDFYVPGAAVPLWTTHHVTVLDGSYSIVVEAGTWDILYMPPPGSAAAARWRRGVAVSADVVLSDQLLPAAATAVEPPSRTAGLFLSPGWPNPARGPLQFSISAARADLELSAWDVAGRRVGTVWRGSPAGAVTVRWDALQSNGTALPAGVYYVRLADGTGAAVTRRVTLVH